MDTRIQLKKELFWNLDNNKLSVYFTNLYLKKDIQASDTIGLFSFLKFLEKPRTLDEIYRYTELSTQEIKDILSYLTDNKYTYETNGITEYEQRIKSFVQSFPKLNYSDYKNDICKQNILIIGLGTAGSYLLESLTKIGLINFTIIDNDTVEEKNILAQNYSLSDIGKKKVDVLYKKYSDISKIKKHDIFIRDYQHLDNLLNLSDYTYIINCADDLKLNHDIISNIFNSYPSIKLLANSYAVTQQMTFLLNKSNYQKYLEEKKENSILTIENSIIENSGSIFNSLFMSLSISKIIFDSINNIEYTDYAYFDFLQNSYFIGNSFDIWSFQNLEIEKRTRSTLFKTSSSSDMTSKIDLIDAENLHKNNIQVSKKLSSKELEYLNSDLSLDVFSYCISSKNTFTSQESPDINSILPYFLKYVEHTFSADIYTNICNFINSNKMYIEKNIYSKVTSYAKKRSENDLYIYSISEDETNKVILIIHELFHIIYFTFSNNSFDHEEFVHYQLLNFVNQNIHIEIFKKLAINMYISLTNQYVTNALSLEYEKYSYLNTLDSYFSKYHDFIHGNEQELITILNSSYSNYDFLSRCKYVIAISKNFSSLKKLGKNITVEKVV